MKTRILGIAIAAGLAFACASQSANAGPIIGGATVTASSSFDQGPPSRLNDQSGLSANYVSGVTDFDTFLAGTTHPSVNTVNGWASSSDTGEFVDFDFGESIDLTRLALFGDDSPNGNNINGFTVLIGNDATFGASSNLGSFNYLDSNLDPFLAQIFDVADGSGRYIRLQLDSNHGGAFGFDVIVAGEVVFEGARSRAVTVSEPGTLAILGLGLAGLGFARRRETG